MPRCVSCGMEFTPSRPPRKATHGRFCSRICAGRAKSKGGFYIDKDGRAFVRDRAGQKIPYSRCLMEGQLGRALSGSEHVHHINGDPADDRIENLCIVSASEHAHLHAADMARGTREKRAKLTQQQVAAIKASAERTSVLARRFGVTEGAIVYHRGALLKAHGRT
jgi:hypothetical protein